MRRLLVACALVLSAAGLGASPARAAAGPILSPANPQLSLTGTAIGPTLTGCAVAFDVTCAHFLVTVQGASDVNGSMIHIVANTPTCNCPVHSIAVYRLAHDPLLATATPLGQLVVDDPRDMLVTDPQYLQNGPIAQPLASTPYGDIWVGAVSATYDIAVGAGTQNVGPVPNVPVVGLSTVHISVDLVCGSGGC